MELFCFPSNLSTVVLHHIRTPACIPVGIVSIGNKTLESAGADTGSTALKGQLPQIFTVGKSTIADYLQAGAGVKNNLIDDLHALPTIRLKEFT